MEERIDKILKVFVADTTYTPDTKLMGELGMSSMAIIQAVGMLEDEFDIEIPDADLRKLDTVGALYEYIRGQL